MDPIKETDFGMMMQRGAHFHFTRGDQWFTTAPDGTTLAGYIPDPDYKEPKVLIDGRAAPEGVKRKLFAFKVMHCGWECDEDGWVVEMEDGSRALVLMNHMSLYVAKPSELRKKLTEYKKVAAATEKALAMVTRKGSKPNGRQP